VLLVIDTRAQHELTGGEYGQRGWARENAARTWAPRRCVRSPTPASLDRLADPVLRRRARCVVTENDRVLATADLVRGGDLAGVGPLLTASHQSLRDDFEVSRPEADAAVAAELLAGISRVWPAGGAARLTAAAAG